MISIVLYFDHLCRTSEENKAACDSRFACFSGGVRTTDDVDASSACTGSLAARSSRFGSPSSSRCLCEMKNWSFWSRQSIDILMHNGYGPDASSDAPSHLCSTR
jgi:hypothetical protein